jgi:hypothetical protein
MKISKQKIKGTIIKVGEDWMVSHNFYDPYGQVPLQLSIMGVVATELTLNENVYFRIVLENDKYFALLHDPMLED